MYGILESHPFLSRETLLKCPVCTPGKHHRGECPASEFYAFAMEDMLSHIQRWHPETTKQEEEGSEVETGETQRTRASPPIVQA